LKISKVVMFVLFVIVLVWITSWEIMCCILPMLLIHELGHAYAIQQSGWGFAGLTFIPGLGIMASSKREIKPGWKEFYVAFLGPFAGLVAQGLLVALYLVWPQDWLIVACSLSASVNLLNLLPLLPLDGGRMVRSLTSFLSPRFSKSVMVLGYLGCIYLLMSGVSAIFLLLLGLVGFANLVSGDFEPEDDEVWPWTWSVAALMALLYLCVLILHGWTLALCLDTATRALLKASLV